jgi:hypothetical protein
MGATGSKLSPAGSPVKLLSPTDSSMPSITATGLAFQGLDRVAAFAGKPACVLARE